MGKWTELTKTLPRCQPKTDEAGPKFAEEVNRLRDERRAKGLDDLAAEYRGVRAEEDAHDEAGAKITARRVALEALIAETFRTEDRDKPYYFPDGRRVEVSDQISVKCVDNDKVLAWVKAKDLERLLSVNPKRLESLTKSALEANEAVPDGVEVKAYSQVKLAGK